MLIKETNDSNEKGYDFDIASSISSQTPFFSCNNVFLSKDYQKDISTYVYCKDLSISPYKGSYGEQPKKWVDKYFIIKNAMGKVEERMKKKAMREHQIKQGVKNG